MRANLLDTLDPVAAPLSNTAPIAHTLDHLRVCCSLRLPFGEQVLAINDARALHVAIA